MTEIEFLGHIISAEGVKVDPKKVAVIADWPKPQDVSELRSFVGLANYYRRFTSRFSEIAAPLTRLFGKVLWEWTAECDAAFAELKRIVTSAPVLAYPNPKKPFVLVFDASTTVALSGVLCQTSDDDDELHPVAFESRKLNSSDQSYAVHELEMLAFVHCAKTWRHFLDAMRFTVYTDNRSLATVMTNRTPSMRVIRWIDWLQSFQFTIKHIPRAQNVVG